MDLNEIVTEGIRAKLQALYDEDSKPYAYRDRDVQDAVCYGIRKAAEELGITLQDR